MKVSAQFDLEHPSNKGGNIERLKWYKFERKGSIVTVWNDCARHLVPVAVEQMQTNLKSAGFNEFDIDQ